MIVRLESVTKKYGTVTALDAVSLSVKKGEACALLGPNGAGKTTIIRVLLDFTHATSGRAFLNDIPTTSPAARQGVGYVAENHRIPSFLTGTEYLRRQAALCGLPAVQAKALIETVVKKVGMTERASDRVGGYSKGMTQRIALAAALLCEPWLLILDEPTSGLDPIGIRELRMLLEGFTRSGITLLLNSHLLSEVEKLCHSAAIINKGKILVRDSIQSLVKDGEALEDVFVRVVGAPGSEPV